MPEIKTTTVQEVEDAIRKFQAESEEEAPKVNDLRTRFELNGAAKAYERCLELLGAVINSLKMKDLI